MTMATFHSPVRRLILAGGFAVAIAAAPAVAVFAVPTTSMPTQVAECLMGEVQDPRRDVYARPGAGRTAGDPGCPLHRSKHR